MAAVLRTIEAGKAAGKPVGVNAFVAADAERYIAIVWRFYTDHLAQWAPDMLTKARDAADTDFYRGVMSLSLGALEQLAEDLGINDADPAASE